MIVGFNGSDKHHRKLKTDFDGEVIWLREI
jgi:hypothetical protein